ncbi:hypothetical protein BST65_15370 [Bradyrhizobium canariense]|nr:hypothetical protein BST65_15370 [Bradyrhizobium canariense]OSI38018.1 hypothetical protein BST66_02795 [Bradyrhizobium canariense]OSI53552.1 hypothetical protein BSZ20_02995 [Bradyrhizobium canariense]OSI56825.1 hypothetical protein BST67_02795 [Bradyrhizobium canariense]OSI59598.1 hypothetical protein BSZ15_03965 [Bradyrhizobium canariense]
MVRSSRLPSGKGLPDWPPIRPTKQSPSFSFPDILNSPERISRPGRIGYVTLAVSLADMFCAGELRRGTSEFAREDY